MIMLNFKKLFYPKILVYTIIIAFILPGISFLKKGINIDYTWECYVSIIRCHADTLRVPAEEGRKRLNEAISKLLKSKEILIKKKADLKEAVVFVGHEQGREMLQEDRYFNEAIQLKEVRNGVGYLAAVMDGEGGCDTADFVKNNLAEIFKAALIDSMGNIRLAMEQVLRSLYSYTKDKKDQASTAIVYISQEESRAYVGIAGNCHVLIVDKYDEINMSSVDKGSLSQFLGNGKAGRPSPVHTYDVLLDERSFVVLTTKGYLDRESNYLQSQIDRIIDWERKYESGSVFKDGFSGDCKSKNNATAIFINFEAKQFRGQRVLEHGKETSEFTRIGRHDNLNLRLSRKIKEKYIQTGKRFSKFIVFGLGGEDTYTKKYAPTFFEILKTLQTLKKDEAIKDLQLFGVDNQGRIVREVNKQLKKDNNFSIAAIAEKGSFDKIREIYRYFGSVDFIEGLNTFHYYVGGNKTQEISLILLEALNTGGWLVDGAFGVSIIYEKSPEKKFIPIDFNFDINGLNREDLDNLITTIKDYYYFGSSARLKIFIRALKIAVSVFKSNFIIGSGEFYVKRDKESFDKFLSIFKSKLPKKMLSDLIISEDGLISIDLTERKPAGKIKSLLSKVNYNIFRLINSNI